jgi:hypothetical protein
MKRKLLITLSIVGTLCVAGHVVTIAAHPAAHEKNAFTPAQFSGVRHHLSSRRARNWP